MVNPLHNYYRRGHHTNVIISSKELFISIYFTITEQSIGSQFYFHPGSAGTSRQFKANIDIQVLKYDDCLVL